MRTLILIAVLFPCLNSYTHVINKSAGDIGKLKWESCRRADDSPFNSFDFVNTLEETDCASPGKGWTPAHLTCYKDGTGDGPGDCSGATTPQPCAILPLYIKGNSYGEFIFDNSWAEAAYQNDIPYYPKLLSHIPFTPATCRKFLFPPGTSKEEETTIREETYAYLKALAKGNDLSSVHVLFTEEEEVEGLGGSGSGIMQKVDNFLAKDDFCIRKSLQWHFKNSLKSEGGEKRYTNFEHYLSNFKSKRRINIRRERRIIREDCGIKIDAIEGNNIREIQGLASTVYQLYKSTVDKMAPWGRLYLNEEFFSSLFETDFADSVVLIVARKEENCKDSEQIRADDILAGTFNVLGNQGEFFGRYWGAFVDVKFLHFDVCYYAALEYVIDKGLNVMEPGAGGGDYKFLRGFDPAVISSAHYITNPGLRRAVAKFVTEEADGINEAQEYLVNERSALKKR